MRSIVFDTGPIISLTTNNLLWLLEPLKKKYKGHFHITSDVKRELIDRPLQTKKFKFEALQVMHIIKKGILVSIPCAGSMFGIYFQATQPQNFSEITPTHVECYKRFFAHMIQEGIYFPPSAYEACFLSSQHQESHLNRTLSAIKTFDV